jgi:hypothetical protein
MNCRLWPSLQTALEISGRRMGRYYRAGWSGATYTLKQPPTGGRLCYPLVESRADRRAAGNNAAARRLQLAGGANEQAGETAEASRRQASRQAAWQGRGSLAGCLPVDRIGRRRGPRIRPGNSQETRQETRQETVPAAGLHAPFSEAKLRRKQIRRERVFREAGFSTGFAKEGLRLPRSHRRPDHVREA